MPATPAQNEPNPPVPKRIVQIEPNSPARTSTANHRQRATDKPQNEPNPLVPVRARRAKTASKLRSDNRLRRPAPGSPPGDQAPPPRRVGPFTLHEFPALPSTSDHARLLLARGQLRPPAIVLTARQTAGRGRGANTWWSGPGCLTATFALKSDPAVPIEQVPLYAGVALRRAVFDLTRSDRVLLKWPNDLMFDERKLAGILCERRRRVDLIGIGLNIAPARVPARLRPRLASLREVAPQRLDPRRVLQTLAAHLLDLLGRRHSRTDARDILNEYDRHHLLVGRRVHVSHGPGCPSVTGHCRGLDTAGRLVLVNRGTIDVVVSGTVRILTEDKARRR